MGQGAEDTAASSQRDTGAPDERTTQDTTAQVNEADNRATQDTSAPERNNNRGSASVGKHRRIETQQAPDHQQAQPPSDQQTPADAEAPPEQESGREHRPKARHRYIRSGGRVLRHLRRGLRGEILARDTMLVLVKSAIAATVSWYLAFVVLGAAEATFAPFSALLLIQATVYRSLLHSLQFTATVIGGVALAGVVGEATGAAPWAMALVVILALAVGQWRVLQPQGAQIAVAGAFAYATFSEIGEGPGHLHLGSIALMVALGAGVAIVTNFALLPPLRYRGAERALAALAEAEHQLLCDVAEVLEERIPEPDEAESWLGRTHDFSSLIRAARFSVEHGIESFRLNPLAWFGPRSVPLRGYRAILSALERSVDELESITRGLYYATGSDEPRGQAHAQFLSLYGTVLCGICDVVLELGETSPRELLRESQRVDDALDAARNRYEELLDQVHRGEIDLTAASPTYGMMLTDAKRMLEEFANVYNYLVPVDSGAIDAGSRS